MPRKTQYSHRKKKKAKRIIAFKNLDCSPSRHHMLAKNRLSDSTSNHIKNFILYDPDNLKEVERGVHTSFHILFDTKNGTMTPLEIYLMLIHEDFIFTKAHHKLAWEIVFGKDTTQMEASEIILRDWTPKKGFNHNGSPLKYKGNYE